MNSFNILDWAIILVSLLFSLITFYASLKIFILHKRENNSNKIQLKKIRYRSWEDIQLIPILVNNEREYYNKEYTSNREIAKSAIELDVKNSKLWTI